MNAQLPRADVGKLNFLSMLNKEVMLWSDHRLESARQDSFITWCFDTGDPSDLKKFKELEEESKIRKTWTLPQPEGTE